MNIKNKLKSWLSAILIDFAKYTHMEERQYNSFSFTAAYNFYQGIKLSPRGKIQKNMTHFVFEKKVDG